MSAGEGKGDPAGNARYDKEEVKRRLAMLDLLAHEGVSARRSGAADGAALWIARCPFHEERTGSFTVYSYDDHGRDHAFCFGCGWKGDVFSFVMAKRGVGFVDALAACASLASVSPAVVSSWYRKQASLPPAEPAAGDASGGRAARQREKPALPRLRGLSGEEIDALARLRNLDAAGLHLAAHLKRVGACLWPQFLDRDGCWRMAKEAVPCWFVTDRARAVIQFRRLDGEKFTRKDGVKIKAWTKGSPTWPLGASEMGERGAVLLCEGGPDMLAAFHFLELFRRAEDVAVCAMLGASCAICEDALPFFRGKRVRIPMHVDAPDKKTGKVASYEAAARWTRQLTAAGAAVESFSLAGLRSKDGSAIEDLNDLVRVDEAEWLGDEPGAASELRALFFDFDF